MEHWPWVLKLIAVNNFLFLLFFGSTPLKMIPHDAISSIVSCEIVVISRNACWS